jgi:hypothetical protein
MCSHVEISLVLEIKTVEVLTYVKSEVVCVRDEESCHEDTVEGGSVALCFHNFGTGLDVCYHFHFLMTSLVGKAPQVCLCYTDGSASGLVWTLGEKLIYLLHQFDPSLSLLIVSFIVIL